MGVFVGPKRSELLLFLAKDLNYAVACLHFYFNALAFEVNNVPAHACDEGKKYDADFSINSAI